MAKKTKKKSKKKKKKPVEMTPARKKAWIKAALRRASYRWPARWAAQKKARIKRGLYRCNRCKGEFKNKEIQLDHIIPIAPDGWDWNTLVGRLFCDEQGFQVLCRPCHFLKTKEENISRG